MAEDTYTFTLQELRDMIQRCPLKALQEWADKIQLTIPSAIEEARSTMANHLNDAFGQEGGGVVVTQTQCCPCEFMCLDGEPCCAI